MACFRGLINSRQDDFEGASLAQFALHGNRSLYLLHVFFYDAQT